MSVMESNLVEMNAGQVEIPNGHVRDDQTYCRSRASMDDGENAGQGGKEGNINRGKMSLLLLPEIIESLESTTDPPAIPKDFQDQAEARQEGQAEPTYPPMVPIKD